MQWRSYLLLIFAAHVEACMCNGPWPSVKQAWEKAPFVFLGTVEVADPDGDPHQMMFQEQFVRIRVDEAFKGVTAGQTIQMHLGATDCDAKFQTGERAVFYLQKGTDPDSWVVPPCTHSLGSATPAGDDLLFLHGLPKSARGTRLSGEVELYEDSPREAFKRLGGVPNVSVRISGPDGSILEAVTNEEGVYEVYNLRPGKYSVGIAVPKGLRIDFPLATGSLPAGNDDNTVELVKNGGASVAFVLKADTRLSGRLLDAKGDPVKGTCIELEPLEGRGENGAYFFNCTKAGGVFHMEMMPAGKYWLVAEDEIKVNQLQSKSTLYYPGVRERENAKVISIEPGKYVKHLDIKLPADEKRYQLTGRLQFADGVPVAGAVVFTSLVHGYKEKTEAAADGSFGLTVVAGMDGQLDGSALMFEPIFKSCPQFKAASQIRGLFGRMDANSISLRSDSDRKDLKLVLPSTSCKAWTPAPAREHD